MNTPAYFAVDNLVVVPEPSVMSFISISFGGWLLLRRRRCHRTLAVLVAAAGCCSLVAPSAEAQGIPANDESIIGWADSVTSVYRGPVDAADHSLGYATFGDGQSALGEADVSAFDQEAAPVVSLGDGGQITLSFESPIADGDGPDFAVFENGFSESFLELAFVEVSADGKSFKRFPATVSNQPANQIGPFDSVRPSGLQNLAGVYPAGIGTPFDLADVGMEEATHVRIIDVVGSIDSTYGSPDSEGNLINDPFPTPYSTGGFDLDAVAVLNEAPVISLSPHEREFFTFEMWATANFDREDIGEIDISGMLADPDSDGLTNFEEYAFWTDPNEFSIPIVLDIQHLWEEEVVEVRLPPIPDFRPDADYSIESASGMAYWESHGGLTGVDADLESQEQDFFRLVVEPLGDDAE